MGDVLIRKGEEKDLGDLLRLIRELAAYERAAGEVESSLDEMRSWGFGPEQVYGFFVAEKENEIVGIALYYYKYSTWKGRCLYLEDLIVTEKERRHGYGALLFEAVVKLAREQKVRRLEWQVLEWNEPALEFYRRYNCIVDDEWLNCRLTDKQLQDLPRR
jgi:GNAT superfamily N-acetyltransferase